jgi:hypothetical protein
MVETTANFADTENAEKVAKTLIIIRSCSAPQVLFYFIFIIFILLFMIECSCFKGGWAEI